jgi:cobalt-precorrin-7 (C5)-methyltransferase
MTGERIVIVGCGPGHPDYLCPIAKDAIDTADVLVGAAHLLELFPDVGQNRIVVKGAMAAIVEQLADFSESQVAVLVSGDSGFFSLSRLVIARFGRNNCRVIPGISSLQLAFSRLALDWSDALCLSAHGRVPDVAEELLAHYDKIALLAGTNEAISWMADILRQRGLRYWVVACENLSLSDEQIRIFKTPELLLQTSFVSRTILLLFPRELLS